ncbi:tRNA1(Val) (adenine(37)-N6)-methyltransferase [Pukyongiella litopenaei]|uniref:Methyltransferase n=1 Tax=Pukyongiella litopenaei TaxID=2605946 RepID=A0A2S0MPB3_9RHOB|nr:methyltransferase [Pukyongiella litopenaei]AVO37708.1 methyltransferase [Pukyongiella litopenaei]
MTGDADLTRNAFLGGRFHLWQPRRGYRAGVDPLLLAASVPARAGQSVLELGCGAGAASLALAARVPGLELTGVELQHRYAGLARRNAAENGVELAVTEADLGALPPDLRQLRFDHVIANPPYFVAGAHSPARDGGRRVALGGETPLGDWIAVAARRLAPRGLLHMIQRAERLPEMLAGCAGRLGSVEILPLCARQGDAPGLVILRARKDGRGQFRMHAAVAMHDAGAGLPQGKDYTARIAAVLRDGAPIGWPG